MLEEVMDVDDLYNIYDLLHLALDEEDKSVKYIQDAIDIIESITDEIYRRRVEMGEITYKVLWEEKDEEN